MDEAPPLPDAMRAARLTGPRHWEVVDVPVPRPAPGEVLIRVRACGVCTSDLYVWRGQMGGGANPFAYPAPPGAPGHETCGTIAAVGDAGGGPAVGREVTAISFPGRGYAEYVLAPADQVAAVPDTHAGRIVLGEPLACATNAVRRSGVLPGDRVLVLGAGFMGLLLVRLLRQMGAAPLVVADVRPEARSRASEHGADVVLDPAAPEFAAVLADLTDGQGVDVVVEATGAPAALDLIGPAARVRGRVVLFGYHVGGPRSIDLQLWNWKGLDVVNGHERDDAVRTAGMRQALELLRYGRFAFDFVTHRFPLEDVGAAFDAVDQHPPDFVKAVVEPWSTAGSPF